MCVCVHSVYRFLQRPDEAMDPLQLEFQVFVGARIQTPLLNIKQQVLLTPELSRQSPALTSLLSSKYL